MVSVSILLVIYIFLTHIIGVFMLVYFKSYNIPIAILRFTGNKGRPMLVLTKGKKVFRHGVPRLKVRGFRDEFRDYLSENYYPTGRGKWGGLVLWEFEDGLLTPSIPRKVERKLSKEDREAVNRMLVKLNKLTGVSFEYDDYLHHELKLKAVDDVDTEFMLQDQARIDGQYSGGWRDFLTKYAGHATIIIIAMLMLVGVVIWFDKMPEFASQCFGVAQQAVQQGLLERGAEAIAPTA